MCYRACAVPSASASASLPASPAPVASVAAPEDASYERPEPGLARGRWGAPKLFFGLVAALTVLAGLAWLLVSLRARRSGS